MGLNKEDRILIKNLYLVRTAEHKVKTVIQEVKAVTRGVKAVSPKKANSTAVTACRSIFQKLMKT